MQSWHPEATASYKNRAQSSPKATKYVPDNTKAPSKPDVSGIPSLSITSTSSAVNIEPPSQTSRLELLQATFDTNLQMEIESRQRLEKEIMAVKEENKSLQSELALCKGDLEGEQDLTDKLVQRLKALEREKHGYTGTIETAHASQVQQLTAKVQTLEGRDLELSQRIEELEQEGHVKEALFQVGVDVRTRYLEQAKEAFWHVKTWDHKSKTHILRKYEVDPALIEKGNMAAHGGNGMADGSLFVLGNLSEDWGSKTSEAKSPGPKKGRWGKSLSTSFAGVDFGTISGPSTREPSNIFEELYHYPPSVYATMPSKLLEAIDCEATIKTLKSLNEGLDRPLVEKGQALEHVNIIVQKHPKLAGKEFDTDADVLRRLDRVKALTEAIVSYDRKKTGRASRDRRPDSTYQFSRGLPESAS